MEKSFHILFNQNKLDSRIVALSKELEDKLEEYGVVENNGIYTYDDSIQSEIEKIFNEPKYQNYFSAIKV